jgi:exosortase
LSTSFSLVRHPWTIFALWILVCSLVFWKPLYALARYAASNDNASHILVIPVIVAWLLHLDRQKITRLTFAPKAASFFAIPALVIASVLTLAPFYRPSVLLPAFIVAFLLFLVSGFVAIFGTNCAKSEWFPLAFLVFCIPLPEPLLNRFIYALQAGSATVAGVIFDWAGVPALRDGFIFRLPKVSIEVATECSGIRSSIALLILALLVAQFSFSRFWKKAVFIIAGLLMMIVKNGVRIATLTILASYVDPNFLYGRLHKEGGVLFFLLGLALLLPVYWFLRRGEAGLASSSSEATLSPSGISH